MFLLFGAFIAGILTILAPCVLPLLPVIIGGSISGDTKDRRRPFIIAASLAVSLIVFTLLLKVTSILINVPPQAIIYFSGGIIVAIGLATLFPIAYAKIIGRLGIEHRAQKMLGKGTKSHSQLLGPIITGAALGPVFSSCSPVYGYILATVLPAHFAQAMAYMVSYVLGLALILLAVGSYGQRVTARLRFASNPRGIFQRTLAVLFILVGVAIITGTGTKIQTFAAAHTPFKFDSLSSKLLPSNGTATNDNSLYNVHPYKAPKLVGIQAWINSNPLTFAQLKGKVVLVDFWTYSCINCIRSLPYVEGWYTHYQNDGLVVIGVQAPEFSFEKVQSNVQAAVKKDKLTYPIALDNNLQTWAAFHNQYWPAEYLIDRSGNVRREHFGESEYSQTEAAIRGLLAEDSKTTLPSKTVTNATSGSDPIDPRQTPETYLGVDRAESYIGQADLDPSSVQNYRFASNDIQNGWSISGKWKIDGDSITAVSDSKLKIDVGSKNVYLVAGAGKPGVVGVTFGGQKLAAGNGAGSDLINSTVNIDQARLYTLASFSKFTTGDIELTVPAGVQLNTFTFGN